MNGNWASLYMTKALGANATLAALALTVFWGAVTVGRILFAAIEKWFPERRACTILPFVVVAGFAATALLPKTNPELGIASFALSGLGCSCASAVIHQFWRKATDRHGLVRRRQPDCVLPNRLRHSRIRRGTAAELGGLEPPGHL